jgi:hypothetical protein
MVTKGPYSKLLFWTMSLSSESVKTSVSETGSIAAFRRAGYGRKPTLIGLSIQLLSNHGESLE